MRNAGGKRERECPKCRDRLFERKLKDSGIKVDVCPTCHGMWFDNRELEAALDLKTPERFVPRDAPKGDRRCPACRASMFRFSYPQTEVEIDMCRGCHGIWLDSRELRDLEDAFASPRWGFLRLIENVLNALKSSD